MSVTCLGQEGGHGARPESSIQRVRDPDVPRAISPLKSFRKPSWKARGAASWSCRVTGPDGALALAHAHPRPPPSTAPQFRARSAS